MFVAPPWPPVASQNARSLCLVYHAVRVCKDSASRRAVLTWTQPCDDSVNYYNVKPSVTRWTVHERQLIACAWRQSCGVAVLHCSLAVVDPRVGHTMDVLSPFISVLWLFHEESCPRLDVVHPGRVWSSSPACTWHCSLHYLFLQATPLFPMVWPLYASFLALTVSNRSSLAVRHWNCDQ